MAFPKGRPVQRYSACQCKGERLFQYAPSIKLTSCFPALEHTNLEPLARLRSLRITQPVLSAAARTRVYRSI